MKDEEQATAGGHRVVWSRWGRGVTGSDVSDGAKVMAWLLADVAGPRGCFPSRTYLVEASGKSESAVKRAVTALREAGWLDVEPGHGRKSSRFVPRWPEGSQTDPQRGQERTPRGVTSDPSEGSVATPVTTHRTTERTREGAAVAAPAHSPSDDPATDERASAIVAAHADLVAAHTKLRPGAPSAKDLEAAADLAARLDPDDWREQVDLALREGLAGSAWMRGQVATVAGLARHIDELTTRAAKSETGPPPAAWDDADDVEASLAAFEADERRARAAVDAGRPVPDERWNGYAVERFYRLRGEKPPVTSAQWAEGEWRVEDGSLRRGATAERERELDEVDAERECSRLAMIAARDEIEF